ncbi:hypothetical protein [Noviherbaspirillum massiliense]|nr:hypothetical protein [Noviherbaspirillum massiliense]
MARTWGGGAAAAGAVWLADSEQPASAKHSRQQASNNPAPGKQRRHSQCA